MVLRKLLLGPTDLLKAFEYSGKLGLKNWQQLLKDNSWLESWVFSSKILKLARQGTSRSFSLDIRLIGLENDIKWEFSTQLTKWVNKVKTETQKVETQKVKAEKVEAQKADNSH